MIEVICIDDNNIPSEIPRSYRVEYGKKYTVTFIHNIARTEEGFVIGFELKEASILELNLPYECWKADRFGVDLGGRRIIKKSAGDRLAVDDFNIDELLEAQLTVTEDEEVVPV
mgnify:CR=1 FL=1